MQCLVPGKPVRPARGVAVVTLHGLADAAVQHARAPGQRRPRHRPFGGVLADTIRSLTISQHVLGLAEILLVTAPYGLQATDDVGFADMVEEATGRRPPWAARAFTDVDSDVRGRSGFGGKTSTCSRARSPRHRLRRRGGHLREVR